MNNQTPEEEPTAKSQSTPQRLNAKRISMYFGVGTAIALGSALITLALTKRVAQQENFNAYINGRLDGLTQGGFFDGWAAAMEHLPDTALT
jgi:hypothetical protein